MMTIAGYTLTAPVCEAGDLVLYRATRTLDGGAVLLKIPAASRPTPFVVRCLEREYELACDLDPSRVARPLSLEYQADNVVLVLEAGPIKTLSALLDSPMDIPTFLSVAIGITAALDEIHRHELIHKDIKPEHVLLDAAGHVWLTGLGIASRLPRERQAPEPPEVIAGTLAYMAPEQTGRMNRSIDSRSDLYALGVTFYQMLTSVRPFSAGDPMELVHCHIARKPLPPNQLVASVPELLSGMVMKLMAKTAEERYQSTVSLAGDLHQCLEEWESNGCIAPFPLGVHDVSERLLIPEKLYGRQSEIETLLAAFGRVVTSGISELVLVSGYSGVGKTAVVNELHKALVSPRGLFASGKFDQYKHDIPYATLVQALQTLVRQILGKSEAEVAAWREAIQQAVSPNGQLIVSLIPEIGLIIGEQPPMPDLPPQEARNRFQMVLLQFVGVFAGPEHPLVLFLDDLQWLDAATLELIEQLVTGQEVHHLLLIGAYRDNEVGPTHPLMRVLNAIRKAKVEVHEIVLAPLTLGDVSRLVADSLHCEGEHSRPLAELVYQKSGGNPFYVIQFFTSLADEKLLSFDPGDGGWSWDLPRIAAKGYTDNIVDLMARKLVRLPAGTQDALKNFACLGNTATIATLCLVQSVSEDELHRSLWEAALPGMVIRGDDAYTFLHDRVQEAAYSLIPESDRPAMHLHIGRLLASRQVDELHETIFEVVNQFNRATALVISEEERESVAELNLLAGQRAQSATAYRSALTYFDMGESLLPEDRWQQRLYTLIFTLALRRAECEFLTGELAAAEEHLAMLAGRADNLVDLAAVTCLRLDLYTTLDRTDRSVDICHEYLRHLGVEWSAHPTREEVLQEYDRMWQRLADRPIESLVDLPLMTDPVWRGTMDVLSSEIAPATLMDGNLLCLVVARMANLSLEHGNTDGSCLAYVYLGMLLGEQFDNYPAAFRFGKLAIDLMDKHGLERYKGRVCMCFGAFVNPWARHIASGRRWIQTAFDILSRNGDLTWAGYCGNNLTTNLLASGELLAEVQQEAEHSLQFAQKARFGLVIDMITGQLGLTWALRGMTSALGSFATADFDEQQFRARLEADSRLAFPAGSYWIRKQQALFAAGEYDAALHAATQAERYLWTLPSFFEKAEYHFYSGLAHAAYCLSTDSEEQKQHLEALAIHHKKIAAWAKNSPENFTDRVYLLAAEIARIEERYWDAQNFYEEAIRAAQKNGFVQNEALGYELASAFYRTRQFDKFADTYIVEARACYARWGAQGKVRQLEQRYPQLREASPLALTGTISTDAHELDTLAVVRASQAISGEILLDNLLKTLMRIVLKNAGARQGYLLLVRNGELLLVADARVENQNIVMHTHAEPKLPEAMLPVSILNYVSRSRDKVLLDDATGPNTYSADEYFTRQRPKSVLCIPITRQTKQIGLLYLENDLATHAFTPDHLAVLELLAAQAAISLENALVYEALQESEAKYRRIIDTANEGIWMVGPDAMTTFVNDRMADMLGYSAAEMVGRSVSDFMFDEDVSDHLKHMEGRLRGQSESYERRLRRRTGGALWTLASGTPIFDDEHRVMGSFAMLTDITERKAYIRDLQRWHDIFEHAEWGVVVGSPDGKTLDMMNPAFAHMHGFSVEELTGRPIADVFSPQSQEDFPAQIRIAHENGHHSFESLHVRKDGTTFPVLVDVTVVRGADGQVMHRIVNVQDITERKKAEDALRLSSERLQLATRVAKIGIWDWDVVKNELVWDDSMYQLYGIQKEDFGGAYDAWARTIYPEDKATTEAEIQAALRGEHEYAPEFRIVRSDGSIRYINARSQTTRDQEGKPLRMIGSNIDITERKLAEDELRRYKDFLEDTVQQRTAELIVARDAAEASNKAKSLFLAHMSHELRTPLNGILGYAQIMQRDKTLGESHVTALGVIRQSGEHLLALIDDILDFARIETGRLELVESDIPLVSFLRIVAEIVGVRARQKGLEFFCELAPDLPEGVRGDERRLRQVLLNLLSNAVKFTDHGHVALSVNRIGLRVERIGASRIAFAVEDSGIGIEEVKQEKIFLPFEQAGDAQHQLGGTGLGLTISRQLVRLMGGDIAVESRVGEGSTFRFELELPEVAVASSSQLPAHIVTGYAGARFKVLIADDVASNRAVLSDLLVPLGFTTVEARDGVEALELAQSSRPDLVLMDIVMPGMDGVEAIRQLRRMPEFAQTPIVVLSARASGSDETQCLEAGADAFLAKPIDQDKLLTQIAVLLHLEWATMPPTGEVLPNGEAAGSMARPPDAEMRELHRLAQMGNMRDIERYAEHIAGLDPSYQPFAAHLRKLAKGYQSKAILAFIEEHLSGQQVPPRFRAGLSRRVGF